MSARTETCPRCKRKFTPDCILPCFSRGESFECCALCALADARELTGRPDYEFTGEMASFALELCRIIYPEVEG